MYVDGPTVPTYINMSSYFEMGNTDHKNENKKKKHK